MTDPNKKIDVQSHRVTVDGKLIDASTRDATPGFVSSAKAVVIRTRKALTRLF